MELKVTNARTLQIIGIDFKLFNLFDKILLNQVVLEPTEDVANVIGSEKKNGKFKVNFVPKVPVAYKIEVN